MDKNKFELSNEHFVDHDSLKQDPDYMAYLTATKFSEDILDMLTKRGIKFPKKYLADSMGVSRSSVSQFFNNEGNYTLKTMVKIALAAGLNLRIDIEQKDVETLRLINSIMSFSSQLNADSLSSGDSLFKTTNPQKHSFISSDLTTPKNAA